MSHAGAWTLIAAEQILPDGTDTVDLGVDVMPTTDRYEERCMDRPQRKMLVSLGTSRYLLGHVHGAKGSGSMGSRGGSKEGRLPPPPGVLVPAARCSVFSSMQVSLLGKRYRKSLCSYFHDCH